MPTKKKTTTSKKDELPVLPFCTLPETPARVFDPSVDPARSRAILITDKKWVNGTNLNYSFFNLATDGHTAGGQWQPWAADESQKNIVRQAFAKWKSLGLGINFTEVPDRTNAQIRIGFAQNDGSWSYVGRDVIDLVPDANNRTMNFGWSLTANDYGMTTALHEIGHTIGLPHEHQNPKAGIVWDDNAVYAYFGKPPNSWDHAKTEFNILRKIAPDSVQGSDWDASSIMHYQIAAGLIREPAQYRSGVFPPGVLSNRDMQWVKFFYPVLQPTDYKVLKPFQSAPLNLSAGQQANFVIEPAKSRSYTIQTFGQSDTVMVLFADANGVETKIAADDDSGLATNALIRMQLQKGRRYVLRVRLYYAEVQGETAVMLW